MWPLSWARAVGASLVQPPCTPVEVQDELSLPGWVGRLWGVEDLCSREPIGA